MRHLQYNPPLLELGRVQAKKNIVGLMLGECGRFVMGSVLMIKVKVRMKEEELPVFAHQDIHNIVITAIT